MTGDPTFFILPAHLPLAASDGPSLLNTITKNFRSPLDNSTPTSKSDPTPASYYKAIGLQTYTSHDFEYITGSSDKASTYAKLKGLIGVNFKASKDAKINLNGKTITYQRLKEHEVLFKQLKDHQAVKDVVPQWIKAAESISLPGHGPPPVCWVTGIFIAFDANHHHSSSSQKHFDADVTLPIAETLGVPSLTPLANPTVGESVDKEQNKDFKAHGKDEHIFALELKVLKLRKGKLFSGEQERNLVNTERSPKVEWGRQLAPEEDEDEDEDSDDSGPEMTGVVKKMAGSKVEVVTMELDFEDPPELGFGDFEAL